MKIAAQISNGIHRDGVHRWSVTVENTETQEIIGSIISESEITADLNAQQLFKIIQAISTPDVTLDDWPDNLQ
ncbi:hypothetical protein [Thalassospira alkalitolerans]|uniref:hypothetical protein n=1 Tax=Thalassospira alkalitolerans TaxID=1293890 RepID=UPI0030EE8A0D|tara:strand:+ start:7574 stop:7792 length:219 start_codon:yes stop_codon:yes gene_type:complete